VPDQPRGKRRRGTQRGGRRPDPRRPDPRRDPRPARDATQPVGRPTVSSGLPGIPWLAAGAVVIVLLIVGFIVLRPAGPGGTAGPPSPGSSARAAAGSCPTSQPPALATGQTRTVTLATPTGSIVIKVEANLSPIAAGNFVALASCGFYDGTPFHRTPTLEDGTPFVIQGGDPTGTGTGSPGYTIKDEPVTDTYKRGTVAMARSSAPNSVGSQFFIVLDDKDAAVLSSANTYQIIGNVTAGMETADAIFAASKGVELPTNPVKVTTATVANP
jgi:cyclophilin family peptidyl-prolyl cis-trans isomerase